MERLKSLIPLITLVLVVFSANGCGTVQGVFASPTATLTNTPIPTTTPTSTNTPTSTPTKPPTPTPTSTPEPTATPTNTPTITPTPTPNLIVSTSLRLREGPGTLYNQIGTLRKGEEYYAIGQYDDCSWLQVSDLGEITGWLRNDKYSIEVKITCPDIPAGIFRPPTGIIMPVQGTRGWSQIKIHNGESHDAVFILTNLSEHPIVSAYIRASENIVISKVFDGVYYLYFATGMDWNGKEFTKYSNYYRFVQTLDFSTTGATEETDWYYTYRVYTISLPISSGAVNSIPHSLFPKPEE